MGKVFTTLFYCLVGMLGSGAATSDRFDYNPGYIRFPFARGGSDFTNTCKGIWMTEFLCQPLAVRWVVVVRNSETNRGMPPLMVMNLVGRPGWYAKARMARTKSGASVSLKTFRPDIPKPHRGPYRNPLIFARELHYEMLRDNLTRVQLGQQHGVTSDRITQWLCLLKLPAEKQQEIEALGDNWDRKLMTERELRRQQR